MILIFGLVQYNDSLIIHP